MREEWDGDGRVEWRVEVGDRIERVKWRTLIAELVCGQGVMNAVDIFGGFHANPLLLSRSLTLSRLG